MGIDLARGLAIAGMIGAHVGLVGELVWSDPRTWTALVQGRSSILFALVAGVSVALATGGRSRPTGERLLRVRLQMAGRALVVLAIGLVLELLGTSVAVILPLYGVLFLVIIPFLSMRRRTLLITGISIALLAPPLVSLLQALSLGASGPGLELIVTGTYPLAVWLSLMLVGMVLGRCDLTSLRVAAVTLGAGLLVAPIGYIAGAYLGDDAADEFSSSWFDPGSSEVVESDGGDVSMTGPMGVPADEIDFTGTLCDDSGDGWISCFPQEYADSMNEWEEEPFPGYWQQFNDYGGFSSLRAAWSAMPHSGGTFEIIGSGGFALGVVGLCLFAGRWLRPLFIPLAAVGSMPLTAYSAHVLSYAILIGPVALLGGEGLEGDNRLWLYSMVALFVGCTAWALTFGRGPLERLTAAGSRRLART